MELTVARSAKPWLVPASVDTLNVWRYMEYSALRILAGWGRNAPSIHPARWPAFSRCSPEWQALPPAYGSAEQRAGWQAMRDRVPPQPFREKEGRRTIAPAETWERINNTEFPQMYPVFPF